MKKSTLLTLGLVTDSVVYLALIFAMLVSVSNLAFADVSDEKASQTVVVEASEASANDQAGIALNPALIHQQLQLKIEQKMQQQFNARPINQVASR